MVKDFFKLIRWPNLLIVVLLIYGLQYCVFIPALERSGLMMKAQVDAYEMLLLSLSMVFVAAGGYIINDIVDVEADKINKPEKTIIGNSISEKGGFTLYALLNVFGIGIAYFLAEEVNQVSLIYIPIIIAAVLWVYSYYLKHSVLVGNVLVALASAAVAPVFFICESYSFIYEYSHIIISDFGGDFKKTPLNVLLNWSMALGVLAFGISLIRELIKDIEDEEGDAVVGSRTLPVVYGPKIAKNVTLVVAITFLAFLAYLLFVKLFPNPNYGIGIGIYNALFVVLPTFYLVLKVWKAKGAEDYKTPSKLAKLIMLTGMINMPLFYFLG